MSAEATGSCTSFRTPSWSAPDISAMWLTLGASREFHELMAALNDLFAALSPLPTFSKWVANVPSRERSSRTWLTISRASSSARCSARSVPAVLMRPKTLTGPARITFCSISRSTTSGWASQAVS